MDANSIAIVCHNANKSYCEQIGDFTQTSWSDAPEWQRQSAIKGVEFHIANPDAPPSSSHDSWLKEKAETGWSYGPVKNPETKEHPCFVPYEKLPAEQLAKDYLFKAVCHALIPFITSEQSEAA